MSHARPAIVPCRCAHACTSPRRWLDGVPGGQSGMTNDRSICPPICCRRRTALWCALIG